MGSSSKSANSIKELDDAIAEMEKLIGNSPQGRKPLGRRSGICEGCMDLNFSRGEARAYQHLQYLRELRQRALEQEN